MKSLTLIIAIHLLSGYHFCMELMIHRPRFLRTSRQNSHFSHLSNSLGCLKITFVFSDVLWKKQASDMKVLNPIIFHCEKHRSFYKSLMNRIYSIKLGKNNVLHIFLSFLIRLQHQIIMSPIGHPECLFLHLRASPQTTECLSLTFPLSPSLSFSPFSSVGNLFF